MIMDFDSGLMLSDTSPRIVQLGSPQAGPALIVRCLGSFRLTFILSKTERPVPPWPDNKATSIFKYIVTHRHHPLHRDVLTDLFWPDADRVVAGQNFDQAIYALREQFQDDLAGLDPILCENSCYFINPELTVRIDSEAFISAYMAGQKCERLGLRAEAITHFQRAEMLYGGDFLSDLLPEEGYKDWPTRQRESLKLAYIDILSRLSQYYFEQNELAICMTFCRKLLQKETCCENSHRRLMRCHLRQGHPHLALSQYHKCVETLAYKLKVPPMPETSVLYKQIMAEPGPID